MHTTTTTPTPADRWLRTERFATLEERNARARALRADLFHVVGFCALAPAEIYADEAGGLSARADLADQPWGIDWRPHGLDVLSVEIVRHETVTGRELGPERLAEIAVAHGHNPFALARRVVEQHRLAG